jgi:hypothetical protein
VYPSRIMTVKKQHYIKHHCSLTCPPFLSLSRLLKYQDGKIK